jgi:hypothetical protein
MGERGAARVFRRALSPLLESKAATALGPQSVFCAALTPYFLQLPNRTYLKKSFLDCQVPGMAIVDHAYGTPCCISQQLSHVFTYGRQTG